MIRVQIYLKPDDDQWLEEEAARRGTTKSALIREGIALLRQQAAADDAHMLKLIGLADLEHETYHPLICHLIDIAVAAGGRRRPAQSRQSRQASKYSPVLKEAVIKTRGTEALLEPAH